MFNEGSIQFYNLYYTAIPIVLYGVYDTDLPSRILYKFPQLYQAGIDSKKFNSFVFWLWILQAMFEAVLVVYIPIVAMGNSDPQSGAYETYWQAGCLTFTAVVIIANEKVISY